MAIGRPCERCGQTIPRGRLCQRCRAPSEERRRARMARARAAHEERHPEHAALYRSPAWRRARAAVLERDGACQIGGACLGRLEVHHLTKLTAGGDPLDLTNLVALCQRHHRLVEQGTLRLKRT